MLRYTMLLLSILFISFSSYTQTIDSLHTDKEVLAFVRKHNNMGGDYFINAPKPVSGENTWENQVKQLKAVTYEKADLDHNGHMDLLFNGFEDYDDSNVNCKKVVIVVLSFDKDSFQFKLLPRNYGQAVATAKVIEIGGKPHIQLLTKRYFYNEILNKSDSVEKTDTLLYAYNNFVELSRPAKHDIEKVSFRLGCGIGVSNNFALTITPDSALLVAEAYPNGEIFDLGGDFVTNLPPTVWTDITNLLQYIRFTELEDQYICHCYDAENIALSISYDGGKVKEVSDQGQRGTYGLETLNELLYQLKYSQTWKRPNLKSLKIDNLHFDEQVLSFVQLLDTVEGCVIFIQPDLILPKNGCSDSLINFHAVPWEKADLDNNGLTDLLFNGFRMDTINSDYCSRLPIAILDMGNGNFKVKPLHLYSNSDDFVARAIVINNKTCIATYRMVFRYNKENGGLERYYEYDTLTYAFDEFIELSTPASYPIESISYRSNTGYRTREEYRISITGDSALLEIEQIFTDTLHPGHDWVAPIDKATSGRIKAILQYIDCSKLKENYTAPWTCDITGCLKIKYNGGNTKKIYDYGLVGTHGLKVLYDILDGLKETLPWKLVRTTHSFMSDND